MHALTIYVKTGCQYCARVLAKLDELGLQFEEKNVADPGVSDELVALGGKKQEPYLIDRKHGVSTYESDDIIDYLEKTYGTGKLINRSSQAGVCELP